MNFLLNDNTIPIYTKSLNWKKIFKNFFFLFALLNFNILSDKIWLCGIQYLQLCKVLCFSFYLWLCALLICFFLLLVILREFLPSSSSATLIFFCTRYCLMWCALSGIVESVKFIFLKLITYPYASFCFQNVSHSNIV